jgi:hypothetical protein
VNRKLARQKRIALSSPAGAFPAPHDHRFDAGIATVAMVTVVTLAAISAATTAARPDVCCDSVATQPSNLGQ